MSLASNWIMAVMTVLGSAAIAYSAADPLSQFRWNQRILLVFADRSDGPDYVKQMASIRDRTQSMLERDLVIISVIGDAVTIAGQPHLKLDATSLMKRFDAEGQPFRVVLIGKDGGSKLSRNRPIVPEELFATIDAMPMRQSEMR